MDPEETDIIDPSLLTKFRRERIVKYEKDENGEIIKSCDKSQELLDTMISKTVDIAISKGIMQKKNDLILPNGPEISGYLDRNIINNECFPIDLSNEKYRLTNKLFITGRVQTKYGLFYLADENTKYVEESEVEILNGQLSYVMRNNGKLNYICFEIMNYEPFNADKIVFTFSITDPVNLESLYSTQKPNLRLFISFLL